MFNFIRNKFHPLWRLRKFAAFRWIQKTFDPDFSVRIHGTRVFVKFIRDFAVIVNSSNLERSTSDAFREIFSSSSVDIFLDVGANIGIYSWMARKYDAKQIFMLEPDLMNCRLLLQTLIENKIKNVYLVPFAASDAFGVSSFYPDIASGATGSLLSHSSNKSSLHSAYGINNVVSVPTLNLDCFSNFCADKNVVMKIDVEGFEGSVLSGSMDLIKKVLPVIIIECNNAKSLLPLESIGYIKRPLRENNNYIMIHETSNLLRTFGF